MNDKNPQPKPGPTDTPKLATAGNDRPKRVPLGHRDRLKFSKEPGYHYHLFNDVKGGNRIQDALAAGYEFVEEDGRNGAHSFEGVSRAEDASQMGGKVTHPVGDGVTGYLMRIPEEIWLSDVAARQRETDDKEFAIHRPESRTPDRNGQYGGVEISSAARGV